MTALARAERARTRVPPVGRWRGLLQRAGTSAPVEHWQAMVRRAAAWLADEEDTAHEAQPLRAVALGRRLMSSARSHPTAIDIVMAAILLAVSVANAAAREGHNVTPAALVLQVALVLPLVWRRRSPVGVFMVVCAAAFVQWLYGERFVADLSILVSMYTVARRCPRRMALAAAAVVEVGVVLAAVQRVLGVNWAPSLVLLTGMVAAAFFLGTNLRTRQAYLAALVERAGRLERERGQQARIAAAAERASIAREMHDIVAHSLAVIITLADAATVKRRSDPEQAAASMEQVSEVGRQALGETRRLLGVLRTEAPTDGFAPQPGLDQLDALLQQVRATGLAAELTVTGRRFAAPGAELAIYRIVQEALTNSIKHARGASRVQVQLRFAAPAIEVIVIDDGRSAATTSPSGCAGHGLVGMHERAALYNGKVTAAPGLGGGWTVQARVSLENGSEPGP